MSNVETIVNLVGMYIIFIFIYPHNCVEGRVNNSKVARLHAVVHDKHRS